MSLDANVLAAEVALAIKSAVGPVVERLAAAESRLATLGDVRDRVVTLEAKAAHPVAIAEPLAPVDVAPILERIAATEARLGVLGDLRDRVVVVETKASQPVPVREFVDLAPVVDRVTALELKAAETAPIIAAIAASAKDTVAMLERRIAAIEDRTVLPGPAGAAGKDGHDGRDGLNGKDGADGVGFDDLVVTQDDERSVTIKAARGERVKDIGTVRFPVEIYRGVFVEGKSYERGDCATFGGSEWHCNESTSAKPGDGSKAWTLKVKKGRDGKDGRDAASVPVVSIKR